MGQSVFGPMVKPAVKSGEDEVKVDEMCPAFDAMSKAWCLIDDLLGGTYAMRDAGKKWLPKEPKEAPETYALRLERAILFSGYEDGVERVVSKPFSNPVTVKNEEKLPEKAALLLDNADLTGRDLTQFLKDVFADAVNHGLSHVFVDFDAEGAGDAGEEKDKNLHPYFTHVKANQLFSWRSKRVNGRFELMQIRIKEFRTETVGNYGEISVPHVRVVNAPDFVQANGQLVRIPGSWELHRRDPESGKFMIVNEGNYTFDRIPLATYYTERTGFMTARPPMEKLAWANLAHWQSYADQRHLLRFVRYAILFMSGVTDEDMDQKVTVGPSALFRSTAENAKMSFVENTGKGAEIGRIDLQDIEDWMEVLGMRPFQERSSKATATGKAIAEEGMNADIKLWIRGLETFGDEIFAMAAAWNKDVIPEDVSVDVFDDFAVGLHASEDVKAITLLRDKRMITNKLALEELKRRGLLGEDVNPENETQAVLDEGPDLPTFGDDDIEDDNEDVKPEDKPEKKDKGKDRPEEKNKTE